MKIFLVRHGETTWNAIGKMQGKSNTHLSKLGQEQAKQIALELKNEKIKAIYSSTLKRAFDTAKEIGKFHNVKIDKRKQLEEINYGMFEGMTFQEIEEKHFALWQKRRKNKYKFKPKGGESFEEMDKFRIKPFVKEIFKKHQNETIAIVAHSGTNRLLMGNFLNYSTKKTVDIWQPNECYYVIKGEKKNFALWHKCVGQKKRFNGYLRVKDIEFWKKGFK